MESISSHLTSRSFLPVGTNGVCGNFLCKSKSFIFNLKGIFSTSSQKFGNVVVLLRSWQILEKSISAKTSPVWKSSDSASTVPFSQIKLCPAKTMSVLDSPQPASAYTYPAISFADCIETRLLLKSALPITSSLAERLQISVAPRHARRVDGELGTHKSSQSSKPILSSGIFSQQKITSCPKNTFSPPISISPLEIPEEK